MASPRATTKGIELDLSLPNLDVRICDAELQSLITSEEISASPSLALVLHELVARNLNQARTIEEQSKQLGDQAETIVSLIREVKHLRKDVGGFWFDRKGRVASAADNTDSCPTTPSSS